MLVRLSRISVKNFVFFHIYVGTETFVNQIYISMYKISLFYLPLKAYRAGMGGPASMRCGERQPAVSGAQRTTHAMFQLW